MLFALFFLGYIDSAMLYRGVSSAILAVGFAYMIQHVLRDVLPKSKKLLVAKSVYVIGGATLGLGLAYIGVGLILAGAVRLSGERFGPGNIFYGFFWNLAYQLFAVAIAPAIGAFAMYRFGKKRRFKTPNYDPDA